jgi:acetylornithine deacetylase
MTAPTLTPRALLEQLVSFPTVSRDSNLPLTDWVQGYLASHGIESHRQLDETGQKASIYAHVGPLEDGGVLLSGHTDVVPVDGQDWTMDPFVVTEKDGKLYGRGTCDMKGFDALAIWALIEASKRDLKRPLQIALTRDEEIGCLGAPVLIPEMLGVIAKAGAVIVGEPSTMQVVTGHKGNIGIRTHVHGFEVHSSLLHTGVSAVMEAAKLIDFANAVNAQNRAKPVTDLAAMFDPPWTTAHVGQVHGGTANNITAKDCIFGFDFRCVPGELPSDWAQVYRDKVAEIEAGMRVIVPDTRIELETFYEVPPLEPEVEGAAEALARALTGDNGTHVVSYATEAGQFQREGYSAVVCGPGDIAQAHQPDEFIEISQFEAGHAFMSRLVDRLTA